jgi:hypothetical protein
MARFSGPRYRRACHAIPSADFNQPIRVRFGILRPRFYASSVNDKTAPLMPFKQKGRERTNASVI